jgi:MSHA pilin protein MshD
LTLIELILFIIIINVGIFGILTVMNSTTRASADPMLRKQAVAMAEAKAAEVWEPLMIWFWTPKFLFKK